jgi:hypothetical protein
MLVHITLAIFAVGGNSFPSALEVKFVLWPHEWFSGQTGGVIPVAICSLVFYLALTRLLTLHYVNESA